MDGGELLRQLFVGFEEVAEIRPRVVLASGAVTARVDRLEIAREPSIPEVQPEVGERAAIVIEAAEQRTVAGVACWGHAVERITATLHGLEEARHVSDSE